MKLKRLLIESFDELEIRNAAWLYMLTYPYKGIMKISSWQNDNRMGVRFMDSMSSLQTNGLVEIDQEVVKSTPGGRPYLKQIFGSFTNEDDAINFGKTIEKYDTPKYDISSIPYDIFEKEYEEMSKSKKKDIYGLKYHDLITWFKKYQRTIIPFKSSFKALLGDERLIDYDKTYTLYRGIFFYYGSNGYDSVLKLNKGDKTSDSVLFEDASWTWSKNIAEKFAKGSTHWMDSEKYRPGKSIAVILKRTFEHRDILMDTYYLDKQGYEFADFPQEKEVVVRPGKLISIVEEIWK